MEERRKFERFDLELPTKIEMVAFGEEKQTFDLMTSDVSAGGAFFRTKKAIPRGTRVVVNLKISTEWLKSLTDREALIEVGGTVVRSGLEGMAIRFDKEYQFLKNM